MPCRRHALAADSRVTKHTSVRVEPATGVVTVTVEVDAVDAEGEDGGEAMVSKVMVRTTDLATPAAPLATFLTTALFGTSKEHRSHNHPCTPLLRHQWLLQANSKCKIPPDTRCQDPYLHLLPSNSRRKHQMRDKDKEYRDHSASTADHPVTTVQAEAEGAAAAGEAFEARRQPAKAVGNRVERA